MLIDWFTTLAQIINFLILLLLLRHFLYGPIIKAMADREARIAERLRAADRQRAEAAAAHEEFKAASAKLAGEREAVLRQVEAEAAASRQQSLARIDREGEERRRGWQLELARQQHSFLEELRRRAAAEILVLARRMLAELADQPLEEQMAAVFIRQLRQLKDQELLPLRRAVAEGEAAVVVSSAFTVSALTRKKINNSLRPLFGDQIEVSYQQEGGLLAGFKLRLGDQLLGWNLESYLAELEEQVALVFGPGSGGQAAE